MDSTPPRRNPLAVGLGLTAAGLGLAGFGALRLASAQISPMLVAWIALPLLGAPLALWAAYQVYGVLTAEYGLDRERLRVRWGLAYEQIPITQISKIERAAGEPEIRPPGGLRLPGTQLGPGRVDDRPAEYFATGSGGPLLVHHDDGVLVISPHDPDAFLEAFVNLSRMGSLERVERRSARPNLLPAQIWADRAARAILLAGLLLPLSLLFFLAVQAPSLPASVPFGFEPSGEPGPVAPTGRLLLLPIVGGLVWVGDFVLGVWFYRRREDRELAYALWGLAAVVAALLWAAGVLLVAAGRSSP